MQSIDVVMITGQSAGAQAALSWVDALKGLIQYSNPGTKVFAAIDSGIFMDFKNLKTGTQFYRNAMKSMMNITSTEVWSYP